MYPFNQKKKKIEILRGGSTAARYNNLLSVFIYHIYISRTRKSWKLSSIIRLASINVSKSFFSTFIYFVINGGADQIIYKSFCQTNESIDIEILKYYISFSYIDDSPYKPAAAFYDIGTAPYMCRDNGLCKSITPPPIVYAILSQHDPLIQRYLRQNTLVHTMFN